MKAFPLTPGPSRAMALIYGSTPPNLMFPAARRIDSVAVIIAVGVNTDGRREVLGHEIGTSEAEADLDGAPSQTDKDAASAASRLVRLRCPRRDSRPPSPRSSPPPGRGAGSTSRETNWPMPARVADGRLSLHRHRIPPKTPRPPSAQWRNVADQYQAESAPSSPPHGQRRTGRACLHDFPKQHWTELHSTNPIERLNGEIKRRH